MKNTLLVLVLLVLGGGAVELSAQAIVQQFSAVSSGAGTISDMDLPQPTAQGSVLIAMPLLLTPGIKVVSITDNAPDGGNTYKQVKGSESSCKNQSLDIWYCENCKAGVTELKFHLSDHVRASINTFLEVSGLELSSVLDGNAVHVAEGSAGADGFAPGPKLTTTAKDFVIARYFMDPPLPTGVVPKDWTLTKSYAYAIGPAGPFQLTLTGGKAASNYCVSMAAFKAAAEANSAVDASSAREQSSTR
jgi:hypothetical protein